MLSQMLLLAGIAIVALLGIAHFIVTLVSDKLDSRDAELNQRLRAAHPMISRQTTMARAMLGFNISHGLGLLLFAAVYGYLVIWHLGFLLSSPFLIGVSIVLLVSYVVLSWRYWFSVPFRGSVLSLVLLLGGYVTGLT